MIAVVVALLVKSFALQAFYIPSASMEPTLTEDDRVLVNKLAYRFGDIERGDVVVFERPPGEENKSIKDLIKRVIAVSGESIETRGGRVYVNGLLINEPYLVPGTPTLACTPGPSGEDLGRVVIPAGQIWVMGDNRTDSADSRCFGPISKDLVVGRSFLQVWPIPSIELL